MKMTTTAIPAIEAVNIFYARQYAYDILRRFFVEEPSKEYLQQFVQKNMIDFFPFKEDSAGIQDGIQDIKTYLSTHDVVHVEQHYQDLHWDYTKLFIGPYELPAPPWESYYVRKDSLLFQETTINVRNYYQTYGIFVRDFNFEADDHIGLELDFLYHLNEQCLEIANTPDQRGQNELKRLLADQNKFLQDHLLQFVSELANRIATNADTGFYKGLAKILQAYLQIDSEVLQELASIEIL
ncbi:molecular chaperone TorD family protein [Bacillus sp. EB600]|nr:molecular chaperone TorD family protein [Bacillus sp. EB600]